MVIRENRSKIHLLRTWKMLDAVIMNREEFRFIDKTNKYIAYCHEQMHPVSLQRYLHCKV